MFAVSAMNRTHRVKGKPEIHRRNSKISKEWHVIAACFKQCCSGMENKTEVTELNSLTFTISNSLRQE